MKIMFHLLYTSPEAGKKCWDMSSNCQKCSSAVLVGAAGGIQIRNVML